MASQRREGGQATIEVERESCLDRLSMTDPTQFMRLDHHIWKILFIHLNLTFVCVTKSLLWFLLRMIYLPNI